jgi:hypothetical protein
LMRGRLRSKWLGGQKSHNSSRDRRTGYGFANIEVDLLDFF